MKKPALRTLALTALILGCNAHAMEFDKPVTASVVVNKATQPTQGGFNRQALPSKKIVTLMNIKLTREQKQLLRETKTDNRHSTSNFKEASLGLPRQAEVSMNGTPVLDQGQHGTCTTFANTAAVDALLGKGDYVSQLCNLELGSYFEQKGYLPSGWEGTSGPIVLNQIIGFGIINKTDQKAKTCGGLKDYPVMNPYNIGNAMSLDDFKQTSENLNEKLDWQALLSFTQRFEWDPKSSAQADALLNEVKKTIATKKSYETSRLSFGSLLPVAYCSAGACARYHSENDTWALTDTIKKDQDPSFGGHEMLIIGYNDDAVAIDNEGMKHQGLLTLRNSWGTEAGDQGNYYMTYDFFKAYVIEVQKITLQR